MSHPCEEARAVMEVGVPRQGSMWEGNGWSGGGRNGGAELSVCWQRGAPEGLSADTQWGEAGGLD